MFELTIADVLGHAEVVAWLALVTAVVGLGTLAVTRDMVRTAGAGITAFALSRDPAESRDLLRRWGPLGRTAAQWALWLGLPIVVLAALTLAALTVLLADAAAAADWPGWLVASGSWLTVAVAVAALAGVTRHAALLLQISDDPAVSVTPARVRTARLAVRVEFGLGLAVIVWSALVRSLTWLLG